MKRQRKKDLYKTHVFCLKTSLKWCHEYFGKLDHLDLPRLRRKNKMKLDYLVFDEKEETVELENCDVNGCYDCENNTIYINVNIHDNIPELCQTFIHEYIHYLQDNCGDLSQEKTWTPNYEEQDVYLDNGEKLIDSLIENEAEYYAQKEYEKLLNYLGYDNSHS